MKKGFYHNSILLLIVLLLIGACKKSSEQNNQTLKGDNFRENDSVATDTVDTKIDSFRNMLVQLDSNAVESSMKALQYYSETFKGEPVKFADSAFVLLQNYVDKSEAALNAKLRTDTTDYSALFDKSGSPTAKQKQFKHQLVTNGFKLLQADGLVYIEQDRELILKTASPMLSDAMKEFLQEICTESKEGFALHGGISITPVQMVARLVWYEKFMDTHAGFILLNKCHDYQKAYLTYLVSGYGTTSIYANEETGELSPFFKTAYNLLITRYKDTKVAQLLRPYYQALKAGQHDKAKAMQKDFKMKGLIYTF